MMIEQTEESIAAAKELIDRLAERNKEPDSMQRHVDRLREADDRREAQRRASRIMKGARR